MADAADMDGVIVESLRQTFSDMQAIYRFGSTVTGDERTGESDVDVAIYRGTQINVQELWSSAQSLAEVLGRDVDIIDLAQASTVMAMQVLTKGRCIYCQNAALIDAYEGRLFSDYARLNEERAGILQDVKLRGSVYG